MTHGPSRLAFPPHLLAFLHDAAPGLSPGTWARVVAPTRAALSRPGVRSHASLARPLAAWAGLSDEEAGRCDDLLDLLQLAIDVADNVADWEADDAAGRPPERRYVDVPLAVLACVPALVMGAVVQALHVHFPPPRKGAAAARRLVELLSVMAAGQGEPDASPAKVEAVSAAQGLLLCLPLWLAADDAQVAPRIADVEGWARAFGRTWELQQLAHEGDRDAGWRLFQARSLLKLSWPKWGPFVQDGPLSQEGLLGQGMS